MFAKLIEKILPKSDKADEEGIFKIRFLEESLISTPTLVLNGVKAENY